MVMNKIFKKKLKGYKKLGVTGVSNELTTRLKYQITSVDGDEKQQTINEFVDNRFLSLDTREFVNILNL